MNPPIREKEVGYIGFRNKEDDLKDVPPHLRMGEDWERRYLGAKAEERAYQRWKKEILERY